MTGFTHPDSIPATIAACAKRQRECQNQKKREVSWYNDGSHETEHLPPSQPTPPDWWSPRPPHRCSPVNGQGKSSPMQLRQGQRGGEEEFGEPLASSDVWGWCWRHPYSPPPWPWGDEIGGHNRRINQKPSLRLEHLDIMAKIDVGEVLNDHIEAPNMIHLVNKKFGECEPSLLPFSSRTTCGCGWTHGGLHTC